MSTEQLKRLAIGLVVLVVLWAGLSWLRRSSSDRIESFHLSRLDRSAVTSIVITRPADTITLTRTGTTWTVNGLAVAPDLVDQLLAALADTAATGEVVAESPSSYARLGVDSSHAKRLTARAGDRTVAAYLIGNRGSSYESVFLRPEQGSRVYEIRSRLGEVADRRLDDWRDKRIMALAGDSIGGIEVGRGRLRYSLDRAGTGWMVGKVPADSAAVSRLLGQLASLTATGFPTSAQADSANFTTPERSLTIRGKTGQVLAALAFDSTANGFWVRREGQPTVFRLESWAVDQITPADSTLRAKSK